MSEPSTSNTDSSVEAPVKHSQSDIISPDVSMMLLTWVTFLLLLALLYKTAWKPILDALDAREEKIRRALEDAQKAHEELERVNQTRAGTSWK